MLNANQGVKYYTLCYHVVKLYAPCYTWNEALCAL